MAMAFYKTTLGISLLAQMAAGENLVITRVQMGDGILSPSNEANARAMTSLISPRYPATTTLPVYTGDSAFAMTVQCANIDSGGSPLVTSSFMLSEIGIFAQDPDRGEILFCVGRLDDAPEQIPAYSPTTITVRRYPLKVAISAGLNVSLIFPPSGFVTPDEMAEKVSRTGDTMTGNLTLTAGIGTGEAAPLTIPHGNPSMSQTNGDIWTQTDGVWAYINGEYHQLANAIMTPVHLGWNTEALGTAATGVGPSVRANGVYSTAVGVSAYANGEQSAALGYAAYAYGLNCTAIGAQASAAGDNSAALGPSSRTSSTDLDTIQLGSASQLATLRCRVPLTVTSDERDKADISDIDKGQALIFITGIEPITYVNNARIDYTYETDEQKELQRKYGLAGYDHEAHAAGTRKGKRRRVGVSAQQVRGVMSEIYGSDNAADIVNDNFHDVGKVPEDGVESQLTVNYSGFIPYLIAAVQEQQRIINALSERIGALEKYRQQIEHTS